MYRKASLLGLAMVSGAVAGAVSTSVWTPRTEPLERPAALSDTAPGARDGLGRLADLDGADLEEMLESLTRVLDGEINERRILAERLDVLDSRLSELTETFVADNVQPQSDDTPLTTTIPPTVDERLVAAGFTRTQLESVRKLEAESQMAAIELDDRARREGWVDTPRYYRESRNLASGATVIRDTLGDDLYDRYLFANGRPNRVAVSSIIETSPADEAGFRAGDVIVRYDGENVYSPQELIDRRSGGVRGEAVAVEVLRDGRSVFLTVPRGPMGLGTAAIRADSAAPPE